MDASYYRDLFRPVVAGRKWLIAVDVLAAAPATVKLLHDMGAERSFVLAGSRGTGDLPDPEFAESVILGTSGKTVMGAMRAADRAMVSVPADVQAKVDAWDPDGEARSLVWFLDCSATVGGRQTYGARLPEWAALEDKMIIDDLWDAAGVARAPAQIVPAEEGALAAAARRLDRGAGTVWVADNREGWHGGGEYLRWVRTPDEAEAAARFMAEHADRARVMPFLEGIPCSIHAMIFPDATIAFNPVELVILRRPEQAALVYMGVAGFWEPPAPDRREMRSAVLATAHHLAGTLGYRGAFGIDGVLTVDGFLPTELNPRLSVGLGVQLSAIEDLSGATLNRALVEQEDLDYRPHELERMVVDAFVSGHRRGGGHLTFPRKVTETETREVHVDGAVWSPAGEGDEVDGTLSLGPGPTGGFVRIEFDPERTPKGPSVAPRVAAAMALADELWDIDIGPLTPAPDARG